VGKAVECGVGIEKFNDIREGDTLEAFIMEEVKA
jgi:translation initiation factor IF-2